MSEEAEPVLAAGCGDSSATPDGDAFSEYPRDVREKILARALKHRDLSHMPLKGLTDNALLSLYRQAASV